MQSNVKKILIVTRAFFPTNSPRAHRATELAIEFAKQGHIVTVITSKENISTDFETKYNLTIKDLGTPKWKVPDFGKSKIGYFFTRLFTRGLQLSIEYPDIELIWQTKNALKSESDYDLLISVANPYPVHWGVGAAYNVNLAKVWIADCGDPYFKKESDTFKKWFYFKYVEKWFMQKASYISVPVETAISAYFPEFVNKIIVIPQGLSFPAIKIELKKKNSEKITFSYSGNIVSYKHYAIPFLNFINTIDFNFYFIIYTKNPEFFKKYLNTKTLEKCQINEYIPRSELLKNLSQVDFLVHFPYLHNTQRSFKLIDYTFLNKPVISFNNTDESKETFIEFLKGNYSSQMPKIDLNQFRIENVAESFLKLLR